ncbi:MAG: DUF4430 domain-containing protein [Firmicutes bacterium]|nr:DUF4430 domain-containing protein [Bacillota bacterium]
MKTRTKLIAGVVILAVLAAAFWYGGGAPSLHGWKAETVAEHVEATEEEIDSDGPSTGSGPEQTVAEPGETIAESEETVAEPVEATEEEIDPIGPSTGSGPVEEQTVAEPVEATEEAPKQDIDPATGMDQYNTTPVPEGKPVPVEPQDAEVTDVPHTCTISIRCDTILDHMDWLDPEKVELVPDDGVILPAAAVTFYEGESVFNLLQRVCRQNAIHMEFENTPMYNSAYIEGIHNLYEFDCGELSGWMYSVNGWFPNYGCSRYALQEGDVVCWVYTCDLGYDVGGHYAVGN